MYFTFDCINKLGKLKARCVLIENSTTHEIFPLLGLTNFPNNWESMIQIDSPWTYINSIEKKEEEVIHTSERVPNVSQNSIYIHE